MDAVKNFAKGTIDGTLEQGATSLALTSGQGARFPAPPFNAILWNATDYPDPSDDPVVEVIRVTAVSGDDFPTILRGQEGTADEDHATGGKTYQLIAAPTKKTIDDLIALVGDVFGSGAALLVDVGAGSVRLRRTDSNYVDVNSAFIELEHEQVWIGDQQGNFNNTYMGVDDATQRIVLVGKLSSNQTASATLAVGTLAAKMPIYNAAGTLVGYVPIYGSIT